MGEEMEESRTVEVRVYISHLVHTHIYIYIHFSICK